MDQEIKNGSQYAIPAAIVAAGALIAGAVIYTQGLKTAGLAADAEKSAGSEESRVLGVDGVKPVGPADHVFGDPAAPVKVVEFSDLECPFCKRFHPTMQRIVDDYGGQVAWIYRHFPIDQLHSKARKEAEAAECAAELGGNEKFWAYLDEIFKITPSNDGLDLSLLPELGENIGLDRARFESCLSSGRHAARVEADYQDAVSSGGAGTPYSVVIAPNGRKFAVSGAVPYLSLKSVVDLALAEK